MKKRFFICIMISFVSLSGSSQNLLFKFSDQQLVEDAVRNGLFVIKQSYQLKDSTDNYFGRNGKEEFGYGYSLGVKVKDGFWGTDKVVSPWKYDTNFEPYRNSHTPIVHKSEYRELSDSTYRPLSHQGGSKPADLYAQKCYFFTDSTFHGKGFLQAESISKEKLEKGWMIWVISDKEIEDAQDSPVTFMIYQQAIEAGKENEEYPVKAPEIEQKIWGGIYVTCETTGIGQLSFQVAGIFLKKGQEWVCAIPSMKKPQPSPDKDNNELTPIKKEQPKENKKKKRNKD